MKYLEHGNDRNLINSDMAEDFLKRGILQDNFLFDELTGTEVYRLAPGFDVADFEIAKKIWQERQAVRKRRRIEDLMSDEAPSKSNDVIPISGLLNEIAVAQATLDESTDYGRGWLGALNQMLSYSENYGEED